ncbi:sporulation histidine kinase inhibitor Sda [Bacillus sp. B1-b2]|uniref:sporulation histidine kinase inhibitor Sda n=1 Tax=Bacillus sp. B1-b2 TaxID=2653201 RepID=UPI001262750F|nr:sporulation histidine kinase inhibitor Sda [Bacillus sp. B1-b2]KAB7668937.1 sporulation histidine kinase inhibitor Sda [Bacillus sp. B1-b2]
MKNLSDEMLIETYIKAKLTKIEEEFIQLLEDEIIRRKLFNDELIREIVRKYERDQK